MAQTIESKQLIFSLNKGLYGFPLLKVKEVVGMLDVVRIPHSPEYVKGVINLRGKIMPLIDLRVKFAMPEETYSERTCVIIVETDINNQKNRLGIIVDGISEVLNLEKEEIEPPPQYENSNEEEFISGITKIKGKIAILLDVEKIVNCEKIINLLDEKKEDKTLSKVL